MQLTNSARLFSRVLGCGLLLAGLASPAPSRAEEVADTYSTQGPLFNWFSKSALHCLHADNRAHVATGRSTYPQHFNFGKTVSLTRFTTESPAESYILNIAALEGPASAYIVNFADYAGFTVVAYGFLPPPPQPVHTLRYKLPSTTPGSIQLGDSAQLVTDRLGTAHRSAGCNAERWSYADTNTTTNHSYGFFIKDGHVVLIYESNQE